MFANENKSGCLRLHHLNDGHQYRTMARIRYSVQRFLRNICQQGEEGGLILILFLFRATKRLLTTATARTQRQQVTLAVSHICYSSKKTLLARFDTRVEKSRMTCLPIGLSVGIILFPLPNLLPNIHTTVPPPPLLVEYRPLHSTV